MNQSIYEFKKVYVDRINSYILNNGLIEKLLTKNFRSNQKIVNISIALEEYITNLKPRSISGYQKELTDIPCLLWEYSEDEFSHLPQKFIDHLSQINTTVPDSDLKIDINKCGILARGHSTLAGFHGHPTSGLSKIELFANALRCWTNKPRTGTDMQHAIQQIGKSISMLVYEGRGNHQYQYCPKSYNHIEWRNQLTDLLMEATNPECKLHHFGSLTWSEWAAQLRAFLEIHWNNFRSANQQWDSVKAKIKAPSGSSKKLVNKTIKADQLPYSEKIRMTTFHDIKGETLDAALIVSAKDKKSKGGHCEHWLAQSASEKEFVRFAYVASSRPNHLLIWAIPDKTNNKLVDKIKKLGFEVP